MSCFVEEWYELENSISPQAFAFKGDILLVFDKLNKQEGRFWRLTNSLNNFFEVDNCLGVILKDGSQFSIEFKEKTTVKQMGEGGELINEFILEGIYYDLVKNDKGDYIFIGIINGKFNVEIFNSKGNSISSFMLSNVNLCCGINVKSDYLYIGCISDENYIKILKINYIGVQVNEWIISKVNSGYVIDKIIIEELNILALLKGKYEKIVVLNIANGELKELNPEMAGVIGFMDINIYEDRIYILSERKIYSADFHKLLSLKCRKKIRKNRINNSPLAYQYSMYIKELLNSFPKIMNLMLAFTLTFIIGNIFIFKISFNYNILKLFLLLDTLSILLGILVQGVRELSDKQRRVEYFLEINRDGFSNWVPSHILISFLIFNIIFYFVPLEITGIVLAFIVTFSLTFAFGLYNLKQILKFSEDVIIELLCDEDPGIAHYVKEIISNMRARKNDRLYINILVNEKLTSEIAIKWAKSRGIILKQEVTIKASKDKIVIYLDLSKRDIKYSRFNILMDCICFIRSNSEIRGVEIECAN